MDAELNVTSLQDLRVASRSITALVFPVIVETILFGKPMRWLLSEPPLTYATVIFTAITGIAFYLLAYVKCASGSWNATQFTDPFISEKGLRTSRTNQVLLAVLLITYTMSGTAWAGHLRLVWVDANLAFSPSVSAAVDGGILPLDIALYDANANFLLIHVCTSVVNVGLSSQSCRTRC